MIRNRRYAAHLGLESIGEPGQSRIRTSRVGLIGLGGLGCAAAQYLVSSGVGKLSLFDFDTVSESNLARQFLYRKADVGTLKTKAAAERLAADNPDVDIDVHNVRADQQYLEPLFSSLDLVLDASDNYGTRIAVNRASLATRLPWIMGACIRMEGQVACFKPPGACYECVYRDAAQRLEDCQGAGIFAPVAGIVGSTMANIALMQLAGLDFQPQMHVFDGRHNDWQKLRLSPDPKCTRCSKTD